MCIVEPECAAQSTHAHTSTHTTDRSNLKAMRVITPPPSNTQRLKPTHVSCSHEVFSVTTPCDDASGQARRGPAAIGSGGALEPVPRRPCATRLYNLRDCVQADHHHCPGARARACVRVRTVKRWVFRVCACVRACVCGIYFVLDRTFAMRSRDSPIH